MPKDNNKGGGKNKSPSAATSPPDGAIVGTEYNDIIALEYDNPDVIWGLEGDDIIFAAGGADTVVGGLGNDVIDGGAGADNLSGDEGDDTLIGGDGDDIVNAGAGNDQIVAGTGNDTYDGGDGIDTITYAGSADEYTVVVTQEGKGKNKYDLTTITKPDGSVDTLVNVENILFDPILPPDPPPPSAPNTIEFEYMYPNGSFYNDGPNGEFLVAQLTDATSDATPSDSYLLPYEERDVSAGGEYNYDEDDDDEFRVWTDELGTHELFVTRGLSNFGETFSISSVKITGLDPDSNETATLNFYDASFFTTTLLFSIVIDANDLEGDGTYIIDGNDVEYGTYSSEFDQFNIIASDGASFYVDDIMLA